MDNNTQKPDNLTRQRVKSVYLLWHEWMFSYGAITLCSLLSFLIPKTILPAVILVLAWLLSRYLIPMRRVRAYACVRVTSFTARVLTITALIMVACLVVNRIPSLLSLFGESPQNRNIPYITVLIIFPVATLVMGLGIFTHGKTRHCRTCKMNRDLSPGDSFSGSVYHVEALFQIKLLFWLSLCLSIINWAYYLLYYSNASINGVDKYFFGFLPLLTYIISLFYTGSRYHRVITLVEARLMNKASWTTYIRYLILQGDRVLLKNDAPDKLATAVFMDTPGITAVKPGVKVNDDTAQQAFETLSGLGKAEFSLRYLYDSESLVKNNMLYHYAIFLKEDLTAQFKLSGKWCTLDEVDRLWKQKQITPMLAAEIHRIYTVTMAWKTYDREGFRRYPIKNYHPTFRLRDLKDWDVKYDDPTWLEVAENNEDQRLFKVRKLFTRISRR